MLIDQWMAKLWEVSVYYGKIALDTPTHFERAHWITFTAICVVVGVLCMRGFSSRKDF